MKKNIFIVFKLFFLYWFINYSWCGIDFRTSGQTGYTIGSTMGPFIAISAAILTFIAFWVQFKANEKQKRDLKNERFESKFYNMVEIYRQNVSEILISENLLSRKAFLSMFNDLTFIYLPTDNLFKRKDQSNLIKAISGEDFLGDEKAFNILYLIFFLGI